MPAFGSVTRAKSRFKAIQAPDDSWTIFDTELGGPAESDGLILVGLDHDVALLVEALLNMADGPCQTLRLPACTAHGLPL